MRVSWACEGARGLQGCRGQVRVLGACEGARGMCGALESNVLSSIFLLCQAQLLLLETKHPGCALPCVRGG